MNLLADIASGETDWADIFFLLGVIFAFLAVLIHWREDPVRGYWGALVAGAVGCIAFGLLLLCR